jgi:uncharacterized membrane protein
MQGRRKDKQKLWRGNLKGVSPKTKRVTLTASMTEFAQRVLTFSLNSFVLATIGVGLILIGAYHISKGCGEAGTLAHFTVTLGAIHLVAAALSCTGCWYTDPSSRLAAVTVLFVCAASLAVDVWGVYLTVDRFECLTSSCGNCVTALYSVAFTYTTLTLSISACTVLYAMFYALPMRAARHERTMLTAWRRRRPDLGDSESYFDDRTQRLDQTM